MPLSWIRRLLSGWRRPPLPPVPADAPPGRVSPAAAARVQPFVRRNWRHVSLQFTRNEAQSRMLAWRPDVLSVDYTRTMMGFLLLVPAPRRIGMVGLGGGSLVKFCHRHLPDAAIEVSEISAAVIALRDAFRIPPDGPRLQVVQADAALHLRRVRDRYDALLVDGYDASGIPPALSTARFYADCRASLAEGGVLVVNLFGDDSARHLTLLRASFGRGLLIVPEPRQSNRVVFAWRGRPVGRDQVAGLPARAAALPLGRAARRQLQPVFDRLAAAALEQVDAFD